MAAKEVNGQMQKCNWTFKKHLKASNPGPVKQQIGQ